MAIMRDRAMGIMDFIERLGADLLTPPQASPVDPPATSPLQMAMNRPEVQFSQPSANAMVTTMPDGTIAMASPTPQIQAEMTGAGVTGPRMNPPQVMTVDQRPDLNQEARSQMPDMGGAGVRMTDLQAAGGQAIPGSDADIQKTVEAARAVNAGLHESKDPTIMEGIKRYFGNRENMIRLALGFNSMRLQPDAGLASVLGAELKDLRAEKLIEGSVNKTVQSLRAIGTPEAITAANMIEANPTMAKTILSEYVKKSMKGDEELIKDEGDLRKEYTSNPTIKRFSDQSAAFGRMAASAVEASPAGDLALIYNFMKLLDPGSTVMQGEFETTARAGGYGERIKGYVENLQKGTTLTPSQRADFMDRANKLYGSAAGDYEKTRQKYVDIAGQYKYDVDRTVPDFYSQNQQRINPSISYSDLPAETKQKFPTEESWNQYFQQLNYLQKLELVEAL